MVRTSRFPRPAKPASYPVSVRRVAFRSARPSDPASRRRPCASRVLHLHQKDRPRRREGSARVLDRSGPLVKNSCRRVIRYSSPFEVQVFANNRLGGWHDNFTSKDLTSRLRGAGVIGVQIPGVFALAQGQPPQRRSLGDLQLRIQSFRLGETTSRYLKPPPAPSGLR
jgi:hypothetical protein